MTARRVGAVIALIVAVTTLAACSQLSALAPVGGNRLAEVRFGAIDVLHERGIDLMTAPACAQTGDGPEISCAGTTADGDDVAVVSDTDDDARLEVSVAGTVVFEGALSEVLDAAARG